MAIASCPSCGAPIDFAVASVLLTVCANCRSVVARTDRDGQLRDLGKTAEIHESSSGLKIGLRGTYRGSDFTLLGCARLKHMMGGQWTEFYACFDDGKWGWVAESQGRFQVTFEDVGQKALPQLDRLRVGYDVPGLPAFAVQEVGSAEVIAADGQMPFIFAPGQTYPYADLTGKGNTFATLSYRGDVATLYSGRQVDLKALGFDEDALAQNQPKVTAVTSVNCPKCAGPLEIQAPDSTERIACPYCGSLLDCASGNLKYFAAQHMKSSKEPFIKLGSKGTFDHIEYVVTGYMVRSCKVEGVRYEWEEYLLYAPSAGYRFLVNTEDHWVFTEVIPAGDIDSRGDTVRHNGIDYKQIQQITARVDKVLGEFYWKVEIGERVQVTEYLRHHQSISREQTAYGGDGRSSEVNWALGKLLPRPTMIDAFKIYNLPEPSTSTPWSEYTAGDLSGNDWVGVLVFAAIVAIIVIAVMASDGGGGGVFYFGSFGGGGK